MQINATIDPTTRVEGHLKVEISVDSVNGVQQVVDATASGTLFRAFEKILINRHPWDAPLISKRICGVCPAAHGMAAVLALDNAAGIKPPPNARILRNLVNGANFVDSHILHFYLLAVPDFVGGPVMTPSQPSGKLDRRLDAAATQTLMDHCLIALDMRRRAHEMGAIFGGRLPHPPAFLPGGFTEVPTAEQIAKFKAYLDQLIPFINDTYLRDVSLLGKAYDDYFSIGRGPGNLLAYGGFELDDAGDSRLLQRGRVTDGSTTVQTVETNAITEQVAYSWYVDGTNGSDPTSVAPDPLYPKGKAYSWVKAPRYGGAPHEVSPLARMWINGDYRRGISVMDRHLARAHEALKIAQAMRLWVDQIQVGQPVWVEHPVPVSGAGAELCEAPRGALGHCVRIAGSKITHYQIITPTCWNASPQDSGGLKGPLERALIGTPVRDAQEPIEVLRVIHSLDPCLDCAVH